MKLSSGDEAKRFVDSILPEPRTRQKVLTAFADAIEEANRSGRDRWAVRRMSEKLRLIVGHHIVCTLKDRPEHGPMWMALDQRLLGTSNHRSFLEQSGDWEWDVEQYPEYSAIASRNGYYSPSGQHAELWPAIRLLHSASIGRAADHRALDPRSAKGHSPEILVHLREELGRQLPDPLH